MAIVDPRQLSVAEIRRRFLTGGEAVSGRWLRRLERDPRDGARRVYRQLRRRREREREERRRLAAMVRLEQVLWRSGVEGVAGVDEVGVGPLAGPVVAAAVVFPPGTVIAGIDDSKRLDAARRESLAAEIRRRASGVGVGSAEVAEIDRLNVYHAALLAMRRAVERLPRPPEHLLVDARRIPGIDVPQSPIDRGDGLSLSIAAASIVAKTTRDAHMVELDRHFPGYGFARHKGYGTAAHQEAIRRCGPCDAHRTSYDVFQELCGGFSGSFYALRQRLGSVRTARELVRLEAEIAARRESLSGAELRKLGLTVRRRWKRLPETEIRPDAARGRDNLSVS